MALRVEGEIPEIRTAAIKKILSAVVPLVLTLVDKLGDGKLNFFEKIGVGFKGASALPDVIAAASDLPDEAWRGDNYDPREIADISDHLETLLPAELEAAAKEITLALMAFILQAVTTTDTIIDAIRAQKLRDGTDD